jgi:hypothetical protein
VFAGILPGGIGSSTIRASRGLNGAARVDPWRT